MRTTGTRGTGQGDEVSRSHDPTLQMLGEASQAEGSREWGSGGETKDISSSPGNLSSVGSFGTVAVAFIALPPVKWAGVEREDKGSGFQLEHSVPSATTLPGAPCKVLPQGS